MANTLKFNTTKPQRFRDMGGEQVCLYRGHCARCNSRVYGLEGKPGTGLAFFVEPDPRGAIPPTHAACSMIAGEFDYEGPDALFCWDCVNEHGSDGYQRCLQLAKLTWQPLSATGRAS